MSHPDLYVSKPGVCFPSACVDNEETLRRVRQRFEGPEREWDAVHSGIHHLLSECNTRKRFFETNPEVSPADAAVAAAQRCLRENRASLDRVDLVIHGSISRQYFEPATAMEVAGKLGLSRTHAFDVSAGAAGQLEAIQAAAGYLQLHPEYDTALVTTSELSGRFVSYDIQTLEDLDRKAAGLTLGDAAACVLVRRAPWPGGGIRLLSMRGRCLPEAWQASQVPVDGPFRANWRELERLGKLLPPLLRGDLAEVGWSPSDVDHYILHQPSETIVRQILEEIGADPTRGVYTHQHCGNTTSAAIGVTLHQLLRERDLRPGDKLALVGGSPGIATVVATGEWTRDGAANH